MAERLLPRVVLAMIVAGFATVGGCKPRPPEPPPAADGSAQVRGAPIMTRAAGTSATNGLFVPADYSKPDQIENGLIRLGWDKLSGFKFDVYEYYPESHAGRALLKSDDRVPSAMQEYNGKRVLVSGFVLPLRTRKGRTTEFLLLRDQGTCCFGGRAQINHFIRVKYAQGIEPGQGNVWQVTGALRVGEIYVQGYLTGIYELEAETVRPLAE